MCYNVPMMDQIAGWLGTGSINIFGLPLCGKDTIGLRLAADLGGRYVSSGEILRAAQSSGTTVSDMSDGKWVPHQQFFDIVLPYFERLDLNGITLLLGGVGRWSGEERQTIEALDKARHPVRACLVLDVDIDEIRARWEASRAAEDRGMRDDDSNFTKVQSRIDEFYDKTKPVLNYYESLGLLVHVNAVGDRDKVYQGVLSALSNLATPVY